MEKERTLSNASTRKTFDLDTLLEPLGGFGKFQFITLLQISTIIILAAITELSYVFTAGEIKHRCNISECETESEEFEPSWLKNAIPSVDSQCLRYGIAELGSTCYNTSFSIESYKCEEFVYETEEWTIAREGWGINCESDRWMLTSIGSFNNGGVVVGSLFVGFLCDRFGRKAVIVSMSIIVALIGAIKSFSVNYPMFVAFEFMEATMEGGLYTLPFVLALEIVDPSKRVLAGAIVTCTYSFGEILVAAIHWLVFDWRWTLRIVRLPFLLVIIFFWTLPESVRWLISKKRKNEAINVLKKIADSNGTKLTDEAVQTVIKFSDNDLVEEQLSQSGEEFIDIFRSSIMRMRFFATVAVWVANSFIFFGMNLNSVSINDNKFVNSILTSLIEMPAYMSIIFLLNKVGRRYTQSCSLFLSSFGCLLYAFVPDWDWAKLFLFLLGKFGIAISFITIDIYTTELFPTPVRASSISTGHMVGRIAAVLAPQTPLLEEYYQQLPLLLFSVMAALGGCLALTLPETLNIKLPDTIEEAENLSKRKESQSKK